MGPRNFPVLGGGVAVLGGRVAVYMHGIEFCVLCCVWLVTMVIPSNPKMD